MCRRGLILTVLFLVIYNFQAKAQDPVPETPVDSLQNQNNLPDTIQVPVKVPMDTVSRDSLDNIILKNDTIPDQIGLQDSVLVDSTKVAEKKPVGDITTTVKYSSTDSINLNVRSKVVKLYGESNID